MSKGNWLELAADQAQVGKVMETNQYTQRYGLILKPEDAQIIVAERRNTLREQKRVEFGQGILPQLIYEFCDSGYISQSNYVETRYSISIRMRLWMNLLIMSWCIL